MLQSMGLQRVGHDLVTEQLKPLVDFKVRVWNSINTQWREIVNRSKRERKQARGVMISQGTMDRGRSACTPLWGPMIDP